MSEGQTQVDVPESVLRFLGAQNTLTLATASPAAVPRASTFLYVNDGPDLYFWSRATTMTARQIQQNPVVAFTIDNYADDLNQTQGVQGIGKCSVLLSGEQIARVADLFGQKFPSLSPGSTMSISFFRIAPTELQLIDNTSSAPARGDSGMFGAEFHRERSYSIVTALPTLTADRIVVSLPTVEVSAGDTIVRQGTPADKFLILVEGEADVVQQEGSETTTVASLEPGQLFGEVSIMRDLPRSATVSARTDSRVLVLSRDLFTDLVAQAMEITPDFVEVVRARLSATGEE